MINIIGVYNNYGSAKKALSDKRSYTDKLDYYLEKEAIYPVVIYNIAAKLRLYDKDMLDRNVEPIGVSKASIDVLRNLVREGIKN